MRIVLTMCKHNRKSTSVWALGATNRIKSNVIGSGSQLLPTRLIALLITTPLQ